MSHIDTIPHNNLCYLYLPTDNVDDYYYISTYEMNKDTDGDFDAKEGQVVIGGGSGEHAPMVIDIVAAYSLYFDDNDPKYPYNWGDVITDNGWMPHDYHKIFPYMEANGWKPTILFAEYFGVNMILFLSRYYNEEFKLPKDLVYEDDIDGKVFNGNIFRRYVTEMKNEGGLGGWWSTPWLEDSGDKKTYSYSKSEIREEKIKEIIDVQDTEK